MNDKELDNLMVTVLWDSMEDATPCSEPFQPSRWHAAQMARMKRNPLAWMRGKTRPVWRKLLNATAAVLLVAAMSWGGLWLLAPEVHATMTSYLVQWSETHLTFLYSGVNTQETLPKYELTYIPEGYHLLQLNEAPNFPTSYVYGNDAEDLIILEYGIIHQGSNLSIILEEDTVTEVTVWGLPGYYLDNPDPASFDMLIWHYEELQLEFMLHAAFDLDTMMKMAESIVLQKK